jgi:hypothetical protein
MGLHLYIYCKSIAPDAGVRLAAAMSEAAAAAGVAARLERRVGDPSTWMEVYGPLEAAAAPGLLAAIDAEVLRHRLLDCVRGRTIEWFETIEPAR